MNTEIAVVEGSGPVAMQQRAATSEILDQINAVQDLMRRAMASGQHYGLIPGCGDKPTLLKPGAELLCTLFRLQPRFEVSRENHENGHREYSIVCSLLDLAGHIRGQGVGSATTLESKHRWRKGERKCPHCGASAIIKGKLEYGGGWLCFGKRGGCGAKFESGDPVIEGQQVGRVENADIADVYNTVLKMAKKRAFVDAVLTATAASNLFTQDVEDFSDSAPDPVVVIAARPMPPSQPQKVEVQESVAPQEEVVRVYKYDLSRVPNNRIGDAIDLLDAHGAVLDGESTSTYVSTVKISKLSRFQVN